MKDDMRVPTGGRRTAAGAATLLGLSVAAAVGGWLLGTALVPANPRDTVVVRMTDGLAFEPKVIEIRAGQTVRWENTGQLPHTVTADRTKTGDPDRVKLPEGAEPFDSELLGAGDAFSHTFTVPGEYRYFCIPHQMMGMVATVLVRPM